MSAPYFTVLIDTYNYGQYIEEAVDSVLAQNFPAEQFEILVVDDGSTDDTPQRLKKYGDRIRYMQKPNGGQASAFNYGFERAKGRVVALLDADDMWLADKLGRMYETFEQHADAGMVYHRAWLWKNEQEKSVDTYFVPVSGRIPESRATLLTYPMAGTSCLAFRREALEKILPVPEVLRSQADAYLTALIIFVAPVVAVPEFLTKYRLHGANLFQAQGAGASRERIEHRMAMREALLRETRNWLEKSGHNVGSPDLQAYLTQWTKAQELDGFALQTPSRWRYGRHLWDYADVYGEVMSGRHRLYSRVRALAALFLGYKHLHWLDDARAGLKQKFGHTTENSTPEKQENPTA
jgi:glycosyltransferase involved in cell wall biosynthesis